MEALDLSSDRILNDDDRCIHRMRNVSDKSCRENQNTHFVFSNLFVFFSKIMQFMILCGKIL